MLYKVLYSMLYILDNLDIAIYYTKNVIQHQTQGCIIPFFVTSQTLWLNVLRCCYIKKLYVT